MAINDISLTAGMRSNLVSLQNTVSLLNRTQTRLSTGLKVNSALDNPVNFFTAKSLNSRAGELAGYKDGMSNAIQAIGAANQGITSISSLISAAKGLASAASGLGASAATGFKYDTANITVSNVKADDTITIDGTVYTAVTGTAGASEFSIGMCNAGDPNYTRYDNSTVAANLATAIVGAQAGDYEILATKGNVISLGAVSADLGGTGTNAPNVTSDLISSSSSLASTIVKGTGVTTADSAREMVTLNGVQADDTITIDGTTYTAVTGTAGASEFSIGMCNAGDPNYVRFSDSQVASGLATAINTAQAGDYQVDSINGNSLVLSAVSANLGGTGTNAPNLTSDLVSASGSMTLVNLEAGSMSSSQLTSLVSQYATVLSQIDTMAADSSFNGVNLLTNASSKALVVNFGDEHSLNVQGTDATSTGLGLSAAANGWSTLDAIQSDVKKLGSALSSLQTASSQMSNNLSIIQTRQDFSTAIGNVLTAGADNLTLADMNEEGANMLMLQTRQSLGTTALSLSSQAAQSVMRLFG